MHIARKQPDWPCSLLWRGLQRLQLQAVMARTASAAGDSGKSGTSKTDPAKARLSHGTKLMLKDGNFQLVRSYERNGERVRYFSVERGDWEEIPAAMVDWDATEKARIADEKADAALVKKVQAQEQARQVVSVVDVDASLTSGPGSFSAQWRRYVRGSGKDGYAAGTSGSTNQERQETRAGTGHFSHTRHSGQAKCGNSRGGFQDSRIDRHRAAGILFAGSSTRSG